MINILTAIGNEKINLLLKKEKNINIIKNDIFYKEGIIEFLEKDKKIDIIIISEKLNGEINIINLIKKIKIINNKINIFIILENKNEKIEKELKKENIKNIFFYNEKIYEQITEKINYKEKNEILLKNNTILIIGQKKSGKTLIIRNLKIFLENKKDINFKEIRSENLNKIKINNKIEKIIFIIELNLDNIKINKKIINDFILKNKITQEKINIIFNKKNKYSINKKIAENIFKEFKILGLVKLNKYCDYYYNKKNNYEKENKILKKEYLKIIRKGD